MNTIDSEKIRIFMRKSPNGPITQQQLAEMSGVSLRTLGEIIRTGKANRAEYITLIANALQVHKEDIMAKEEGFTVNVQRDNRQYGNYNQMAKDSSVMSTIGVETLIELQREVQTLKREKEALEREKEALQQANQTLQKYIALLEGQQQNPTTSAI